MAVLQQVHSGTMEERPSKREILHGKLAGKLAAEGMVLLKNEGVLPLKTSAPAGLFGGGAVRTVKGGTGSGDVNNRENISVYRGLKEAGVPITSEEWLIDYEKRYEDARNVWKEKVLKDAEKMENPFDAYALNPFSMPEGRSISEEDVKGALTALYVISRISGEGKDRSRTEGDYYLSRQEREDILFLNRQNMPIVLILNVGAPVELTDILQEAENIKGILLISLPGQEGGHAAANVLLGKSVPGGRLTATWAKRYEDYPSAEEFGALNGNLETEEYREGIYVGYRYFSSFGVQPLFPFGYGLSYTEFSVDFDRLEITETGAELIVTVKNIGKIYASREVVQVYVTLPQKEMEEAECSAADEERIGLSYLFGPQGKECYRLAGFARTGLLQPGESQQLRVVTDQKQMAGFSEEQQAWIVEKGSYGLWLGKHAESLEPAAILTVPESVVLERTERIRPAQKVLEEFAEPKSVKENVSKWLKMAKKQKTPEFLFHPRGEQNRETKYSVTPMPGGQGGSKEELKGKEQELSVEELIPLLYGNVVKGASTLGSSGVRVPGSAGETTETLEHKYGVRSLIMADGPAGLRLRQSYQVDRKSDSVYGVGVLGSLENGFLEEMEFHEDADTYYQYCTAFPVGTALAQTWDVDLMREFGRAVALEMEEFYVDLWLAPGMNIQRNPLCGRNFEYYSEDPFLSGKMAAAVVSGVQADGNCGVTVKHFACNNQEDNRMSVNVCISPRALREIYLRGFEIAVRESRPVAVMSSYNRINGFHAANFGDICTGVLRKEWGFEGVVMSDWNTTVPADGSISWKCAVAGNDIIMPGNPQDDENIRQACERGELSEEAIRTCGRRVLAMIRKLT
ncbi:glycoside hydrolase family 3 N-terminal domain-containing protein [Lachnospiraceae bacterium KK002]